MRPAFVSAGSGKLLVFLHGFPHFWYQYPQLAEFSKDQYVVAPDMRLQLNVQAPAVEQYRIEYLVEDVRALAEHLGHKQFVLVGHDWGRRHGPLPWRIRVC